MFRLLARIEQQPKPLIWTFVFASILVLAIIDYKTGPGILLSALYLFPISLTALLFGRSKGIAVSLVCTLVWYVANWLTGQEASQVWIPEEWIGYWNAITRFGFFAFVTLILCTLKETLQKEQTLARRDFLTGALNTLSFHELAESELARLRRYKRPFTLISLDLDNFKTLNDTLGHETGDQALKQVIAAIRGCIRETDAVARLGGDEFVVLLVECPEVFAPQAVERIRLAILAAMQSRLWDITPSMGVLTCVQPPAIKEMLALADKLMYEAKKKGGNQAVYSVYGQDPTSL